MIYKWHRRRYSLRYCIGYRVLNKVYIYTYKVYRGYSIRYYFWVKYKRWYSARYSIGYSPRSLTCFI